MSLLPDLSPDLTLDRAVKLLVAAFTASGAASPHLDARILIAAAAGVDHAGLICAPYRRLGPQSALTAAAYAARRMRGEPVARILGQRQFWSLDLTVTQDVLDPRADTETVVSCALAALGARRGAPFSILDLGTGSGALICALLSECPAAFGVAVDLSPAAARVARANLARHGLLPRAAVAVGRWGDALARSFDLVVSNPPYIRTAAITGLMPDVRGYDPALALDGGADGLVAYREICAQLPRLLAPGGIVCLECGDGQAGDVADLLRAAGFAGLTTTPDLAGHARVVSAR